MTLIGGMGLSCPLGRTARSSVAALQAGLTRYEQVDAVTDLAGEPARASRRWELEGEQPMPRALTLAAEALREAVSTLAANVARTLPIYVAAPPEATSAEAKRALMEALESALPAQLRLHWGPESISTGGRDAGGKALAAARHALRTAPMVLVGGLDCLAAGAPLERLAAANRLLGDSNQDGRISGEGAAFLLLVRSDAWRGQRALGLIHALATAQDPRPFTGALPCRADGLTAVFSALRETWPARLDQVVMAQSHERFWGSELSVAYLRNVELMPEPMVLQQLAENLGDCGAAAFLIGIVWSLVDFDPRPTFVRSTPVRRNALVYSSSDEGAVVGAIVCAPNSAPRTA